MTSGPPSPPHVVPVVYIVDDDISVRESLELLVETAGWQPLLFASAPEFLAHPRAAVPACLVLDVNLPELNGLELQRRLADEGLELPIIFITGRGDVPMTVRAMKAGAVEFLTKPFDDEVLLVAIRDGLARSEAALLREAESGVLRARYASLTARERDVMALIIGGLSNKLAGNELGISEVTVKGHRGQVMRKMQAASFAELVQMGARLALLEGPGSLNSR